MRVFKRNKRQHSYYGKRTVVYLSSLAIVLLVIATAVFAVFMKSEGVFAGMTGSGGGAPCTGQDCGAKVDVAYTECSGYICYAAQKAVSGFSWVYVPTTSDYVPFSSLPFIHIKLNTTGGAVEGCAKAGGFYIFARNTYYGPKAPANLRGQSTGYMAGPEKRSSQLSLGGYYRNLGFSWGGAYQVDEDEAKSAYDRIPPADAAALGINWDSGNVTWFCDWGGKKKPKKIKLVSCGNASSTQGAHAGNTVGKSEVINYSNSYNGYNSRYQGMVIGKPGDTIMFCHSLSFGNRYVGTGLSPNEGDITEPLAQWFKIGGGRDGAMNNDAYTFRDSTATRNPKFLEYTIPEGNRSKTPMGSSSLSKKTGVQTGSYWFTVYSPYTNDNYRCSYGIYNVADPFVENGFQAPGFFGASCGSTRTGDTTQVGHFLTQSITYDDLRGWDEYTRVDTGVCNCGKTDANHNHYVKNNDKKTEYITSPGNQWGWWRDSDALGINVCEGGAANTCHGTGDPSNCDCDAYGNNCSPCKYSNLWYDKAHTIKYYTHWKNYGRKTQTAYAYFPYNYRTDVSTSINQSVKFLGGSVIVNAAYQIVPRVNKVASKDMPSYATHTPPNSKFRFYEMILPPDYDTNKIGGNDDSAVDVCGYYSYYQKGSHPGRYCHKIGEKSGPFNPAGNYAGDDGTYGAQRRQIPDDAELVGYKYCVASSMWPARSHQDNSNSEKNNTSGPAMSGGVNRYNISGLSCVTIAKKPNFQVWGGAIYSKGSFVTSISKKRVGGRFAEAFDDNNTDTKNNKHIFGSWDEYGLLVAGEVKGMASGAAFGYEAGYRFNLPKGGVDYTKKLYDVSPETISNYNKNEIGKSGITQLSSTVLPRLKARYYDKAREVDAPNNAYITQDTSTGTQYVYFTGNASISSIGGVTFGQTGSNRNYTANLTTRFGYALAKGISGVSDKMDNTLIIRVDGTLTIDRDICYSDNAYACATDPAAKLRSYNLSSGSIAKLPQILIFAKNIVINSDVDRVEAWLIADEGTIKTCNIDKPDSNQCNKVLVVNGPTFAKQLILSRTAGSGHGYGNSGTTNVLDRDLSEQASISPAEIFNLRSDAYYWAYSQAQRSTEAVTTYVRELAPRY